MGKRRGPNRAVKYRNCDKCGHPYRFLRADSKTCSDKCRQQLKREKDGAFAGPVLGRFSPPNAARSKAGKPGKSVKTIKRYQRGRGK
jgi:hypothetical protein